MSGVRFPGESDAYRAAREELLEAEIELRRQSERVAAKRRALPPGGLLDEDYLFEEGFIAGEDTRPVRLSELFGERSDTLMLYSFMYGLSWEAACPSCTSFIDALDGELEHITQQIGFAIVARAPIERLRVHARERGWRRTRLLSSCANSFNADYHAEDADGEQLPIAHVFVREDGRVRHFYSTELLFAASDPGQHPRHIDPIWPLWSVLDMTPRGRGEGFSPALRYAD